MTAGLSTTQLRALSGQLFAAGESPGALLTAERVSGGQSNLTYRLADTHRSWILRTPPQVGGTPTAHDVIRESRVTAALQQTPVPVPRTIAVCEDRSVLGAPFTIVEFVEGHTLRTQQDLLPLDDPHLHSLVRAMVAVLADLHRVDHVAAGLQGFGRPDGYPRRQLRRWSAQWAIVGGSEDAALAERLIARLSRALPPQRRTCIVHGDFRIDNTIVGEREVRAVVDWELSTIGDAVADVAMMCAYRDPTFDLITGESNAWTSPRLPKTDELAAAYEDAAGLLLNDWDFHMSLAYFKIGVIAAGIDHRRRTNGSPVGTARKAVARYFELASEIAGRW